MVLINLLPWRVQAEVYLRRQRRVMLLSAAVLAVIVILLLHVMLQYYLESMARRVNMLNEAIAKLQQRHQAVNADNVMGYTQALNQLVIYENLTSQFVKKLNEPRTSAVCFKQIARYHGGIRFSGYGDSVQALSTFVADWPAASHFNEIRIEALKPDLSGRLEFVFTGIEKQRFVFAPKNRDRQSRG